MALRRVKYIGPHPEVELEWPLPGGRTVVKKGGHLDVPTRKAQEMARQSDNWEIVEPDDKKDEAAPEPNRRVHTQDDDSDVEQATAAPGEKRNTRRKS
jgi:hypothetical protein